MCAFSPVSTSSSIRIDKGIIQIPSICNKVVNCCYVEDIIVVQTEVVVAFDVKLNRFFFCI